MRSAGFRLEGAAEGADIIFAYRIGEAGHFSGKVGVLNGIGINVINGESSQWIGACLCSLKLQGSVGRGTVKTAEINRISNVQRIVEHAT